MYNPWGSGAAGVKCNEFQFLVQSPYPPGPLPLTTATATFVANPAGYDVTLSGVHLTLYEFSTATVSIALTQSICPGTTIPLRFQGQNLASASVDNGIGSQVITARDSSTGNYGITRNTVNVTPTVTTTYTITGVGLGGETVTASCTLTILDTSVTLAASRSTIYSCLTSTLSWVTPNATSVSLYANGTLVGGAGSLSPNSSQVVAPTVTTTYRVQANNSCNGYVYSNYVTVTVASPSDASTSLLTALITASLCGPVIPPASTSTTGTGLTAFSLSLDGPGRPCAASAPSAGIVTGYISQDAGHTFSSSQIVASGSDASLLIDIRQNRFCVIYAVPAPVSPATTPPAGIYTATGYITTAFPLDAGSPAIITSLSGTYPVAASHPTDRDYVLLAYLSGGSLQSAYSLDAGATWTAGATIASGLSFTATGRAALAMEREMAAVVYGSGSGLKVQISRDRGMTWASAAVITPATSGPYQSLSLLSWQGQLYLLAFTTPASPATPVPALFASGDTGATWGAVPSTFPAGLAAPSGLGMIPSTGQLRLGITHFSPDMGATWAAD